MNVNPIFTQDLNAYILGRSVMFGRYDMLPHYELLVAPLFLLPPFVMLCSVVRAKDGEHVGMISFGASGPSTLARDPGYSCKLQPYHGDFE